MNQNNRTNYRQMLLQQHQNLIKSEEFGRRWRELCGRFLPITENESIWRFSRTAVADDPAQGWKIHVAATILTACEVLEKTAPLLISRRVLFKAPISLEELDKINGGLKYTYTQVGKFITVYPQSSKEAVLLAKRLHRLTAGLPAPAVPFDLQYRPQSCVYYRYGAFIQQKAEDKNGKTVAVIRNPVGNLFPDARDNPQPDWVSNPFSPRAVPQKLKENNLKNPLKTTYKVFRALRQRGKGGVYQAVDFSAEPPRICIIKEGRIHGEIDWDGWDGFRRVKLEERVLTALQATDINAPRVYDAFELERNYYLVTEYIAGKSLHELLEKRRRRFSIKRVLKFAGQIAELVGRIHRAGWVWRDCKPANIIVAANGSLRPLDFEGGSPINQPNIISWRTEAFSPAVNSDFFSFETGKSEDLYALGAVVYYLLTAKFYQPDAPLPIEKLRRDVPEAARRIIDKLLSRNPLNRPPAIDAAREFNLPAN